MAICLAVLCALLCASCSSGQEGGNKGQETAASEKAEADREAVTADPADAGQQASTSDKAEAVQQGATQAAAAEEETMSEGTDTPCEVSSAQYTGSFSSMFLSEGDLVAVISPSALPTRKQVDAVVKGLNEWGYETIEGQHVCEETAHLAGA